MQQITNNILMIRPANFNYNDQTASNNYYQKKGLVLESVNENAQKEFDLLAEKLKSNGINVLVFDDDLKHETPSAIFPNNWISFHSNGDIAIYPMFAINRRLERRED
ncbi:MAG TPA: amidinotransferase, partial [Candidatus Marinimicrobia bacterium]|nr:amidinotransferase [Candidatus Neomarinimicrobiota bacterium]